MASSPWLFKSLIKNILDDPNDIIGVIKKLHLISNNFKSQIPLLKL